MIRGVPARHERPVFVATDIDGTLLNVRDEVPDGHRRILARVVDAGATLCLATGRPPRWLPEILGDLGQQPLAVCANGAVIIDTSSGDVLWSRLLEPEALEEIARIIHSELPGVGLAAERMGRDAIDDEFITAPDYRHAWIHPESVEVGHDEVIAAPVLKLLARVPGMSSSDMAAAVSARVEHLAQVTFSTENGLIEFAPPGVTKAAALTRVAEQVGALRFRREPGTAPRTVAFGDMPNDVEMLRWADLGVAMGNAHPIAAAAADETTLTSDEAGLEPVLSRWF